MFFLCNCFSCFLFSSSVPSGTSQQDSVAQAVAGNVLRHVQHKLQPSQIWAFVRCLSAGIASSRSCPQHCGVMLTDTRGNILDTRGFYKSHGSVQEFNMPSSAQGVPSAEMVKFGLPTEIERDWNDITTCYDKVQREDYRYWSNNCCSVARNCLSGIRQPHKSLLIDQADKCAVQ